MPTVLLVSGYRFFFYANDHPPKHIHVEKGEGTAKFNLLPVELVKSKKFSATELNTIRNLVVGNQKLFSDKWDEFFNDK